MKANLLKTRVEGYEGLKVVYRKRKLLFFEWEEVVKTDSIGKQILIMTNEPYVTVYLNGKRIEEVSK